MEKEEEELHLIFSHRHSAIVAIVAIRLPLFSDPDPHPPLPQHLTSASPFDTIIIAASHNN